MSVSRLLKTIVSFVSRKKMRDDDFVDQLRKEASVKVDEARHRFANSLVGRWSTASGSFSQVMDQLWDIRQDGTGKFTNTGPFGHPRDETSFLWQQESEFVFRIRLVKQVYDLGLATQDETEFDETEYPWLTVRYDFMVVATDFGFFAGLVQTSRVGTEFEGFSESLAPLVYIENRSLSH
jgi:hypothetical protein